MPTVMNPGLVSLMVFMVVLGVGVLGSRLRSVLPLSHFGNETWPVAALGIGFISTMNAIVLGLLVASAKSSYDATAQDLEEGAAKIILLDRTLRQNGPETQPIRASLRDLLRAHSNLTELRSDSATSSSQSAGGLPVEYGYEQVEQAVRSLSPASSIQRALQTRAVQIIDEVAETRWLFVAQKASAGVSPLLLGTLVAWLAVIAGCTGLFAPRHATMFVVALLCALAISGTVFLLMSMYSPFSGPLKLSTTPMTRALEFLEQP
jgi:hypothetical protein